MCNFTVPHQNLCSIYIFKNIYNFKIFWQGHQSGVNSTGNAKWSVYALSRLWQGKILFSNLGWVLKKGVLILKNLGILWLSNCWDFFLLLILALLKVQFWQFFMLNNFEKSSNLVKMVKLPCFLLKKEHQKLGTRVLRFKKPNPISLKSPRFKTRFVGFLTCFATIDNSLIPQMHFYSKTNFFLVLFSAGRFKRKATWERVGRRRKLWQFYVWSNSHLVVERYGISLDIQNCPSKIIKLE